VGRIILSHTNLPIFSAQISRDYGAFSYSILSGGGFEGVLEKAERWRGGRLKDIPGFIDGVCGHELHAKRVGSLARATLGIMAGASLHAPAEALGYAHM
jgi:hypothetical protein